MEALIFVIFFAGAVPVALVLFNTVRLWGYVRLKGYTGPGLPIAAGVFYVFAFVPVVTEVFLFGEALIDASPDPVKGVLMWVYIACALAMLDLVLALVVFLLPTKHRGRGGPSGRRFPWTMAGWVLTGGQAVLALFFLVSLGDSVSALRFLLGGLAMGYLSFQAANRQRAFETGRRWHPASGEPFVLYIRGFRTENRYFAPTPRGFRRPRTFRPIDWIMAVSSTGFVRFDEFFRDPVGERVGPLTGLGSTTDFLPPDGALRVYQTTDDWQATFAEMVTRSEFILAEPGCWQYLPYELCEISRLRAQSKLMICTEPLMDRKVRRGRDFSNWQIAARQDTWDEFAAAARSSGFVFGPDPGPGSIVTFETPMLPVVLATGLSSPHDYVDVIVRHLRDRPRDLVGAARR